MHSALIITGVERCWAMMIMD